MILQNYWVPDLRIRVEKFLNAALSMSETPLLISLVVSLYSVLNYYYFRINFRVCFFQFICDFVEKQGQTGS